MTQRQRQEQMAVAKPHPLKGIINSNDDPIACGICFSPFVDNTEDLVLVACCGKAVCPPCFEVARGGCHAECGSNYVLGGCLKQRAAMVKRNAKKGQPWAQDLLGGAYYGGHGVTKSSTDAIRWWERASKKGHPTAAYNVGLCYLDGRGRRQNLAKALQHLQLSLSSSGMPYYRNQACGGLCDVAKVYANQDTDAGRTKAKSILLPLLDSDCALSQVHWRLGFIYHYEGSLEDTYHHYFQYAIAAENENVNSVALNAAICKEALGDLAQARFWAGRIKLVYMSFPSAKERKEALVKLVNFRRQFRELRDICGGCGIEFEGKERKFCRACRTFCYCSRECQKMHWNRKDGGHREDCKGLVELKKEMKEASRRRLMSSSTKGCC